MNPRKWCAEIDSRVCVFLGNGSLVFSVYSGVREEPRKTESWCGPRQYFISSGSVLPGRRPLLFHLPLPPRHSPVFLVSFI